MARIVQDPGGPRPGTAVVLRGKQGTGKGVFVTNFGALFGQHFLHLSDQRHFTGRFNSHLKDALLVFIDEGYWAGDKAAEGSIKRMITEDTITIEPKGKDIFSVKNHINLIIASNHEWVIPAAKEERRFVVLDVSDKHMKERQYFRKITDQMKNGGREAMLYDLLKHKHKIFDLRSTPRTGALLDQIIETMTSTQRFWYEVLRRGYLVEAGDWPTYIKVQELHAEYIEFAKDHNISYRDAASKFGKELRKVCAKIIRKQITLDGKRQYVFFLPNLDECRELFENNTRIPGKWGDDG
jgi:phage/plasmid-associated DNA primase